MNVFIRITKEKKKREGEKNSIKYVSVHLYTVNVYANDFFLLFLVW